MTSLISFTAVLVLAMVLISAGGSKGQVRGQVKGQAQDGQGVGETRRRAGKKNDRNQNGIRNIEGKEIIARDGSRFRKVNKKPVTEANLKRKSYFKQSKGDASVRVEDKFGHCDYIDLVEVGHRDGSDCAPGGKILFKVLTAP